MKRKPNGKETEVEWKSNDNVMKRNGNRNEMEMKRNRMEMKVLN